MTRKKGQADDLPIWQLVSWRRWLRRARLLLWVQRRQLVEGWLEPLVPPAPVAAAVWTTPADPELQLLQLRPAAGSSATSASLTGHREMSQKGGNEEIYFIALC